MAEYVTCSELIALLQRLPGDTRVVIDGYEGGLEDVVDGREVWIHVEANNQLQPYPGGRNLIPTEIGLGIHRMGGPTRAVYLCGPEPRANLG